MTKLLRAIHNPLTTPSSPATRNGPMTGKPILRNVKRPSIT